MSDEELIYAATSKARGLTPETYEIIDDILKTRDLKNKVSGAIEAQNKNYTVDEIDKYCNLLQILPCPICGSTANNLNGSLIAEAFSILLVTNLNKNLIVACPGCLDDLSKKASRKTSLLGWWGIPWGAIRTIQAMDINEKSRKVHHSQEPNNYLRSFTYAHIGKIEANKDNKEKLQEIIA